MVGDLFNLQLLANEPIYASGVPIYSPLLSDIAKIGETQYNEYINIVTIGKESFDAEVREGLKDISDFELALAFAAQDDKTTKKFYDGLRFFTGLDFEFTVFNDKPVLANGLDNNKEEGIIRMIDAESYDTFKRLVYIANNLDPVEALDTSKYNPTVAKFLEREKKRLQFENERNKHIKPTLKDVISSVANMSSNDLNIINIWDINIYTLYEQLERGMTKENYEGTLASLRAGADAKKVKVEHYLKRI